MGVEVCGALSRVPCHSHPSVAHLVIHCESSLMHCLDGYLGSTYSGRGGRSEREWVQGSTLGWFNGTGKHGDKGWRGVISDNSLRRCESGHSTRPRGLYVQGVGGSMRPQ